jgi:hypothetical protein
MKSASKRTADQLAALKLEERQMVDQQDKAQARLESSIAEFRKLD